MDTTLVHTFILIVLLPAWLIVGLIDWWCHRVSRIEDTAGPRESILHLVLSGEAAAAILPALLLEINAAIIALMIVMLVVHEITSNIDLHIATPVRAFTTAELHVHNFLTAIPFAGVLLVMATHSEQSAALFGVGDASADFSLRWKDPPLPLGYLIGWLSAAVLFNIVPFTEELLRGLRKARKRS
jgi:hypothetical protein